MTCTEPIGIGAQENKLLCDETTAGKCSKCSAELCEFHLDIHKNRHKVLDHLVASKSPTKKSKSQSSGDNLE